MSGEQEYYCHVCDQDWGQDGGMEYNGCPMCRERKLELERLLESLPSVPSGNENQAQPLITPKKDKYNKGKVL